ncbi:MAG: B12-binding domain-containing radical SAM protein, partial [Myxococcota bacterium]
MTAAGLKITFVEPKAPGLHIWSRFRLPRLGPLMLGAALERAGHDVRVQYEQARRLDWKRLRASDLVCISTITSTAPRAYHIADQLRARSIPVVMGGVHPTYLPDEAMRHADYVLRGEADETILPLVDAIEHDAGFHNVKGLTWRAESGDVIHNEAA